MKNKKINILDNFQLDVDSSIPYYYQLKQFMIEKIESGEWEPSQMLPYEKQLCLHFNVSRAVIRQTLRELNNEGFIFTRKGKGTFIAEPQINEDINQNLIGFYETWTSLGYKVANTILELRKVKPSKKVTDNLKLKSNKEVILLKRLSRLDDKPYSISTNYVPYERLEGILNEDFTSSGLYTILEQKYNMELIYGESTIEIVTATKEEAELLNVKMDAPLFFLEGISFLKNEKPLVFYQTSHIGENSKIRVQLKKSKKYQNKTKVIK